jgi:predicted TIM-barrel fold metal-dependent hydrolase
VSACAVNEPPVVDAHAHVFDLDTPLAPGAWHRPAVAATVEQYLATLDAHGVQRGVLAAASIYGTHNGYALQACGRHARLRTTVILEPACPLAEMKSLASNGVVGIRLQWRQVAATPDLAAAPWPAFLRRIAELGWHVELHDDSARLARPLAALEAAGVNTVVDHFGRPDAELGTRCPGFQRLLRSVETGRTWIKLSSAFRLATPQLAADAAHALLCCAGPERLMWGSDWPFAAFESSVDYGQTLGAFADWIPDAAARRRIGGATPLAFYFNE